MLLLRRSLYTCAALWLLAAIHAFGAASQVGTCTGFTPQFATIQAAVTAASSGQTIYVCPGSYPEQITITQNLMLKGLQVGHSGLAAVTVPAGGMVVNTATLSGFPIAAQIFVTGTTLVSISDITVDGNGNGIATCGTDLVGIYFQNASGTVTQSSVLNEVLPAGFTGCQSGEGIYIESGSGGTSTVNVNNTTVENYQKNGITGNRAGTTLTATNNTVVGQGSTTGAAENGIQIGFGAAGTITSNTITDDVWGPDTATDPGDAAAGILVYASPNVDIESNQVTNSQFGIAVVSDPVAGAADHTTIRSNAVNATHIFDAIDVCSNNNAVQSNTIRLAGEAGIHLDDTCGATGSNNVATGNTVNTACAGILMGPTTTGNSLTQIFYNVQNVTLTGNTCTLPATIPFGSFLKKSLASTSLASKVKKVGRPKFMPVRP